MYFGFGVLRIDPTRFEEVVPEVVEVKPFDKAKHNSATMCKRRGLYFYSTIEARFLPHIINNQKKQV